jgi:hypothetical protein
MKTILAFLLSFSLVHVNAQSSDPVLDKRLNEYLQLNRQKKFGELVEYMHPSIFSIVPKEQLQEAMEKGFDSEEMKITVDSIKATRIGPVFNFNGGSYHKVDTYMELSFYMNDKEMMADSSFSDIMISQFKQIFPNKTVTFSSDKTHFTVAGIDVILAIKDDGKSPWMFLGFEESKKEMLKTLIPKEVVEGLKL